MRRLLQDVAAYAADVAAVAVVVWKQRRLTGFRIHECCGRFQGEKHASHCVAAGRRG